MPEFFRSQLFQDIYPSFLYGCVFSLLSIYQICVSNNYRKQLSWLFESGEIEISERGDKLVPEYRAVQCTVYSLKVLHQPGRIIALANRPEVSTVGNECDQLSIFKCPIAKSELF